MYIQKYSVTSLSLCADVVYIEPIEDIDISNSAVGQTLTIGCRVATCQESMHIAIVKGTQLLKEQKVANKTSPFLYVHVVVSDDITDQYACRVLLPDGRAFYERFIVMGMCHVLIEWPGFIISSLFSVKFKGAPAPGRTRD